MPGSGSPSAEPAKGSKRSFLRNAMKQVGSAGRDMMSVALGRWLEEPEEELVREDESEAEERRAPAREMHQRVNVLHNVAEKLRGAADSYIAAKLDEIEARVDEKLDNIERRIDEKIVELHEQLAEMRDRELRHRLRLLKITLIFMVIVALLSLGYKVVSSYVI